MPLLPQLPELRPQLQFPHQAVDMFSFQELRAIPLLAYCGPGIPRHMIKDEIHGSDAGELVPLLECRQCKGLDLCRARLVLLTL